MDKTAFTLDYFRFDPSLPDSHRVPPAGARPGLQTVKLLDVADRMGHYFGFGVGGMLDFHFALAAPLRLYRFLN